MAAGNTARLYRIEALIRHRGHVTMAELMAELEVSRATLIRDIEYLRSRMGAPIEYDAGVRGYRFGDTAYAGPKHELPGLWFDESELYSLLMAQQLLAGLDTDGLLSRHLQPLLARLSRAPWKGAVFPAGANPARQLSLQPEAIGATVEETKLLKPSV